jgi:hypothetical protein
MSCRGTATALKISEGKTVERKRENSAVLSVCCLVWKWPAISKTQVTRAKVLSLLLQKLSWIFSQVRFAGSVVRSASMCEDVTVLTLAKTHCCLQVSITNLSIYLSSIYLSTNSLNPPSIRPPVHPSIHPSIRLPTYLPTLSNSVRSNVHL